MKGHYFDEPMLCVERFAEILAEEAYRGRGDSYRSPILLSCGAADDPADLRLDAMFREWAERYAEPLNDLRPDFKSILLAGLAARDRSRLIVIEHSDETFGDECKGVVAGLAELLGDWDPGDHDGCPPVVLLSAVIGSSGGPREAGYLPLATFPDKEARMSAHLAALRDATPLRDGKPTVEWFLDLPVLSRPSAELSDVRRWLDGIARREAITLPPTLAPSIERELGRLDQFPVRLAKLAVDETVQKQGI
jgi:hypothetical protein